MVSTWLLQKLEVGSYVRMFEWIDIYMGQVKDYFCDIFIE